MPRRLRQTLYLATCAVILILWVWFGRFEAIEVPYVGF